MMGLRLFITRYDNDTHGILRTEALPTDFAFPLRLVPGISYVTRLTVYVYLQS